MALRGGHNFNAHTPLPVTLPPLVLAKAQDDPDAIERKELAAKLAEQRVVREGQEALEAVNRGASFTIWVRLAKALLVGKQLAVAQAGNDWGRTYSKIFSTWIKAHHFDRLPAPTISVTIELGERLDQIVAWRESLPARQRKRLIHPLSVTRAWRQREQRASADIARYLRTFVSASRKVTPDQASIPIEDLEAALAWLTACRTKAVGVCVGSGQRQNDGPQSTAVPYTRVQWCSPTMAAARSSASSETSKVRSSSSLSATRTLSHAQAT